MRLVGHVARIGEMKCIQNLLENLNLRYLLGDMTQVGGYH
jgi:hypothetical protein